MPIEVDILRYLNQHPEAKDTAEGIAKWWLLGQPLTASLVEVKAGLDRLVARGRMAAEQGADGTVYYYRAKAAPTTSARSGPAQAPRARIADRHRKGDRNMKQP